MIVRCLASGFCVALVATAPHLALGQAKALQHDPFARPAAASMLAPSVPTAAGHGAPAPKLRLNAVMAAGSASMANVDGVMVRLGDSVYGYRLVEVRDRMAVFEKNKARFTLTIRARAPLEEPGRFAPAEPPRAQPAVEEGQ